MHKPIGDDRVIRPEQVKSKREQRGRSQSDTQATVTLAGCSSRDIRLAR